MSSGYEHGTKEFCCAVIELAVADYRGLMKSGKVKGVKITEKGKVVKFKCKGDYSSNAQVEDLMWFMSPESKALEGLLDAAGINIDAETIRKAAGLYD